MTLVLRDGSLSAIIYISYYASATVYVLPLYMLNVLCYINVEWRRMCVCVYVLYSYILYRTVIFVEF